MRYFDLQEERSACLLRYVQYVWLVDHIFDVSEVTVLKKQFRNLDFFLVRQAALYRYSGIHKFVAMPVLHEKCCVQFRWKNSNA